MIITVSEGKKYIYVISTEGSTLLIEQDTDEENGTSIKVPIKSEDFGTVRDRAIYYSKFNPYPILISGKNETDEKIFENDDMVIFKTDNPLKHSNILIDGVRYDNKAYNFIEYGLESDLRNITNAKIFTDVEMPSNCFYAVLLKFTASKLTLAAHRETVNNTPDSPKIFRSKIDKINKQSKVHQEKYMEILSKKEAVPEPYLQSALRTNLIQSFKESFLPVVDNSKEIYKNSQSATLSEAFNSGSFRSGLANSLNAPLKDRLISSLYDQTRSYYSGSSNNVFIPSFSNKHIPKTNVKEGKLLFLYAHDLVVALAAKMKQEFQQDIFSKIISKDIYDEYSAKITVSAKREFKDFEIFHKTYTEKRGIEKDDLRVLEAFCASRLILGCLKDLSIFGDANLIYASVATTQVVAKMTEEEREKSFKLLEACFNKALPKTKITIDFLHLDKDDLDLFDIDKLKTTFKTYLISSGDYQDTGSLAVGFDTLFSRYYTQNCKLFDTASYKRIFNDLLDRRVRAINNYTKSRTVNTKMYFHIPNLEYIKDKNTFVYKKNHNGQQKTINKVCDKINVYSKGELKDQWKNDLKDVVDDLNGFDEETAFILLSYKGNNLCIKNLCLDHYNAKDFLKDMANKYKLIPLLVEESLYSTILNKLQEEFPVIEESFYNEARLDNILNSYPSYVKKTDIKTFFTLLAKDFEIDLEGKNKSLEDMLKEILNEGVQEYHLEYNSFTDWISFCLGSSKSPFLAQAHKNHSFFKKVFVLLEEKIKAILPKELFNYLTILAKANKTTHYSWNNYGATSDFELTDDMIYKLSLLELIYISLEHIEHSIGDASQKALVTNAIVTQFDELLS